MPGIKRKEAEAAGPSNVSSKKFKHEPSDTNTSKEAHAKQKALARERKAGKPNADSIQRAKKLWERLRRKSHVEPEERKMLVKELFDIITGNVKDFVFKHDSVRVIQCAVKYANMEQKKAIAKELKGEYKSLAESRYAKFLVAKLLVEDKDIREMIVSEFYGHVRRLINHPEASWILDDTYRQVATPAQKAILLREWYGSEFAIFKSAAKDPKPTADLCVILSETPEKRKPIMSYLYNLINQLVQKKMTGFTMLHDAMLQYSLAAGAPSASDAGAEFLELLKGDDEGDLLKNLAFTKSGSRIVCRALALSSAKDRKTILKTYKESIELLAYDPNGVNVLLATYEVVDDTVMTSKLIFPDLLATKLPDAQARYDAIVAHANHIVARLALLFPFAADRAKWLIPNGSDTARMLEELRVLRAETSKKDPELRRQELVKAMSGHDGVLLATIANRAPQLVESPSGCQFIAEVLLGAEGDKGAAMAAVAELARGDPDKETHIARSAAGGRMLKTLVLGARFDPAQQKPVPVQPRLGFADVLYTIIKGSLTDWAVGASSFVVSNLMEDEGFREKPDVRKRLQRDRLEAAKGAGNKGAELLLQAI